MADKTIGELDELLSLQDSSLIPVQQGGSAYHITGAKLKAYAESAASSAAEIAVEGTIEDAQAWATGMRGSASVSTSDPTYHNNSKYFYEQAQAQAAAATSAASTFTTDTTLSVSGKAADAAKTGQVKRDLWSYNVVNILTDYVGRTHNGITFSGDTESKTFTVTGTASSGAFCNIMGGSSIIPTGLSAGGIMCFRTSGLSESGVYIRLYLYPNTLPNRERIITSGTIVPIPDSCVGMLARLEVKSGTSVNQTVGVEITNALPAGDVIAAYCEKEIKILCFGSSFTYSTLGYLPHVLRDIDPHVHLVLGICYDSGQTLSGHSTKWDNDTPYTTYSEYDSWIGSWTSLSESVSGKDAVDRYKWDYICL